MKKRGGGGGGREGERLVKVGREKGEGGRRTSSKRERVNWWEVMELDSKMKGEGEE